ncbi:MAG: hypothetical protein WC657_09260 [Candidatus Paceibacterota bacterium]
MGCGIEPRNEKQIAEAETVGNVEGSMEAIVSARCPCSAGVKGHITDERILLEPRKPRRGLRLVPEGGIRQGTTGVWHRAEGGVADRGVVLMMPPKENSTRRAEGRPRPEGSPGRKAEVRTQGRAALPANLARVNEAARRGRQTQFTALLHHIDVEALRRSFHRQRKKASAGVDGVTVKDYEVNLEENLKDLCESL